MIKVNIDNREVLAEPGQMLIDVADSAGISIPRFCYHPKLSVAANCRMCLVEVAGFKKAVPACATAVSQGMVVNTQSSYTKQAQQSVMEFLLINHPLDCPICDQGGECELQDVAMGYGQDVSRFVEQKRVVKDKDIGPLIQTDLTRCIHCTRCVRFGQEVAGVMELGMCGRGEYSEISSFLQKSIDSEMSGNVIDVCPVGALTSKPFRYSARVWEMSSRQGVAGNDSAGSNLYHHVKNNQIKRAAPAQNETINEVWLSDKDRFAYEGVNSFSRLLKPIVKVLEGYWEEKEWDDVLPLVVEKLQQSKGDLATVVGSRCTLEEMYLAQKLTRVLGSNHIDHRFYQKDFTQQDKWPRMPISPINFSDMEQLDSAFIIGSDLCYEHPMVSHRLRRMSSNYDFKDIRIWQLNEKRFALRMPNQCLIANEDKWLQEVVYVLKSVLEKQKSSSAQQRIGELGLDLLEPSPLHSELAERLLDSRHPAIILGNLSTKSHYLDELVEWVDELAEWVGGKWVWLPPYVNSVGGWVTGCMPHVDVNNAHGEIKGDHCGIMRHKSYDTLLSVGAEIGVDISVKAKEVIALTTHKTAALDKYATIMLPISCLEETAGTMINLQGDWQSFNSAANPPGEAKSAWKILRVLGHFVNNDAFSYTSGKQVCDEIKEYCAHLQSDYKHKLGKPLNPFQATDERLDEEDVTIGFVRPEDATANRDIQNVRIEPLTIVHHRSAYDDNMVLRHCEALHQTKYARQHNCLLIHPDTVQKFWGIKSIALKFRDVEKQYSIDLMVDESCEKNILSLPNIVRVNFSSDYDSEESYSYYPAREVSYIIINDELSLKVSAHFVDV